MFDIDSAYHVNNPYKVSKSSSYGENGHSLYKVKTTKKKPYLIKVDCYDNDLHFIKFYPKNLHLSKDKYRQRIKGVNELSRIVATCIKIAQSILKKNPDACFGFYGQWDEKDVINTRQGKTSTSQRYRIYLHAVINKVSANNFMISNNETFNLTIIIPKHKYSEELLSEISIGLLNKYLNNFDDFIIPQEESDIQTPKNN